MVLDKPSLQDYFNQGVMPDIQHWITEELHRDTSSVVELSLDTEMVEVPNDGPYKCYKPGDRTCTATFADGAVHSFCVKRSEEARST